MGDSLFHEEFLGPAAPTHFVHHSCLRWTRAGALVFTPVAGSSRTGELDAPVLDLLIARQGRLK